ncbi:pyrimidine/purine nucleoside phosphorylase [Roseimaritima ulvae]|nr:pyrimidine/purine nucleoside phosphorylase [Roseimaritima ulvae]
MDTKMALQVNEYFDGKVKSIGFENGEGRATAGVMAAGEYQFGTSEQELMKVVSGELNIRLPGETDFQSYPSGSEFRVEANVKFDVRVETPTAYVCFYGG